MRLQRLNVVKETDDPNSIAKLKTLGYQEIQETKADQPREQIKPPKGKALTELKGGDDHVKQSKQIEAAAESKQ